MNHLDHEKLLAERKARFAALLTFVSRHGGWLVSTPGNREVRMQCLPSSTLPDLLRSHGYVLHSDGEGQRILPGGVVESFLVAGSSIPQTRVHAGLASVSCFTFNLP